MGLILLNTLLINDWFEKSYRQKCFLDDEIELVLVSKCFYGMALRLLKKFSVESPNSWFFNPF